MEYKVIYKVNAEVLTNRVNELINEGWEPIGSHKVVEVYRENRFSGMQIKGTVIDHQYSQTLIKKK